MAVEINGYYRHFHFLDNACDARLPLAVFDAQLLGELRHRAGREEAEGVTLTDVAYGGGNAAHRLGTFLGVVACQSVNVDEVGAHGGDVVQNHVDHDLEVGAVLAHYIDEHNAVERAKGVVRHGDECTFGQIVEHLLVAYLDCDVEVFEQSLGERHSWSVEIVAVNPVDLVDGNELEQPVAQFLLALEERYHFADVAIVEHSPLNRLVFGSVLLHIHIQLLYVGRLYRNQRQPTANLLNI